MTFCVGLLAITWPQHIPLWRWLLVVGACVGFAIWSWSLVSGLRAGLKGAREVEETERKAKQDEEERSAQWDRASAAAKELREKTRRT